MRNRGAILLLLAAALSACTGYRKPEIELESVTLGSIGFGGGTVLVNVRVENPNPVSVRADSVRYELFLRAPGDTTDGGWNRLTSGLYEERIVIGARDTEVVSIPVQFSAGDLRDAGASVLRTGSVNYRVEGRAWVRAAGMRRVVPFRKTGSVLIGR
ncbi:MAG TPA: LEA type 2 family protein [Longimicrobium sp.]|nr:LEA type 2 family protein [Longimicrobium sp.]